MSVQTKATFALNQNYATCPNCKHQISLHPNIIGSVKLHCPRCSESFRTEGKK